MLKARDISGFVRVPIVNPKVKSLHSSIQQI